MAFDIERYKDKSRRLDTTGIAWERVAETSLSPQTVSTLTYMMDIESHTAIYLSELLVSRACMDPLITDFLACWAYEEMHHGDALKRFLREYGIPVTDDRPRRVREQSNTDRVVATLAIMLGSHFAPTAFSAVYLSIGAINEMTTLIGYQRLADRAQHPVLSDLLARIIKQECVHFAFYRSQAERHLRESRASRRLTRAVLRHQFSAVGEGVKSHAQVDELALHLFQGVEGERAVRRIDDVVDRLPGLAGLGLVRRRVDKAIARDRIALGRTQPAGC